MTELTVQCGGWPRQYVAWLTSEAGDNPPPRDWRADTLDGAVQAALAGLGLPSARVIQVPDCDEPGDCPDRDLGVFEAGEPVHHEI